jgi:hypothetical protein
VPWSPRSETLILLDQVKSVLEEYAAYLPLTCRQIFYRLVGAHGYEKTENAYARLYEMLNSAVRSLSLWTRSEMAAALARSRTPGKTPTSSYAPTGQRLGTSGLIARRPADAAAAPV